MPSDFIGWAQLLESIFTIIGITVGGFWVYFNFFRGRTYKPRLSVRIDAENHVHELGAFVIVKVSATNTGLSHVKLQQYGSGIKLEGCTYISTQLDDIPAAAWRRIGDIQPILSRHEWIESSESLTEDILFPLSQSLYIALRVTVRLRSSYPAAWEQVSIFANTALDRQANR